MDELRGVMAEIGEPVAGTQTVAILITQAKPGFATLKLTQDGRVGGHLPGGGLDPASLGVLHQLVPGAECGAAVGIAELDRQPDIAHRVLGLYPVAARVTRLRPTNGFLIPPAFGRIKPLRRQIGGEPLGPLFDNLQRFLPAPQTMHGGGRAGDRVGPHGFAQIIGLVQLGLIPLRHPTEVEQMRIQLALGHIGKRVTPAGHGCAVIAGTRFTRFPHRGEPLQQGLIGAGGTVVTIGMHEQGTPLVM